MVEDDLEITELLEQYLPRYGLELFSVSLPSVALEKLSIEHISAQRAKNVKYDDEFNERFMHSIGNLVIDYTASNSSKGNKNTKDKLQAFNLAPLMSQNEIDEIECDWENVDSIKTFIKVREEKLKLFIKNNFKLSVNTQTHALGQ